MAQGRMLLRKVSKNADLPALVEKLNAEMGLPHGQNAALLFTWCIAHLDVAGRMHGDPRLVRADVVPLLEEITTEHVRRYLTALQAAGLVHWYEAGGRRWLEFPAFLSCQPGLRKEKEPESAIPSSESGVAITAEVRRQPDAVSAPEEKRREEKLKGRELEEKVPPQGQPAFALEPPQPAAPVRAPRTPKEPADGTKLLAFYEAKWVATYQPADGQPPKLDTRDKMTGYRLVKDHGLEQARKLVERYLADADRWLVAQAHALRHLQAAKENAYRATEAPTNNPTGDGQARTRDGRVFGVGTVMKPGEEDKF